MGLSSTRRRRCDALGQRFKTQPRNHSLANPDGVTFTPTAHVPVSGEGCCQSRRTSTLWHPSPDDSLNDSASSRNVQTVHRSSAPSPESLASHSSPMHLPSIPAVLEKNNYLFKRISRRAAANFSCHSLLYTIPPPNVEHRQPLTVQTGSQSIEQGTPPLSPDSAGNGSLHTQAVADGHGTEAHATGDEGRDVSKQTDLRGKYAYAVTASSLACTPKEKDISPKQQPFWHASRLKSVPKSSAEATQVKSTTEEALCSSQQWNFSRDQHCNTPVLNRTSLRYFRDTSIRRPISVLAAPTGREINRRFHVGSGWRRAEAPGDRIRLQVINDSLALVGARAVTASPLRPVSARTLRCRGGKSSAEVKPAASLLSDSLAPWTGTGSDYSLWQRQRNPELLHGVFHPQKDNSAGKVILQDPECPHVDAEQLSSEGVNYSVPIRDFRLSDATNRRPSLAGNACAVAPEAEEASQVPDVSNAFRPTVKGGVSRSLVCWGGKRICGSGESNVFFRGEENIPVVRPGTKEALDTSSHIVSSEGVESDLPTDVAAIDGYHRVTPRFAGDMGQKHTVDTSYTATLQYGCGHTKNIRRRAEGASASNTKRRCVARDRRPKGTNPQTLASDFEEAIGAMRSVLTLELCKFRDLIVQREVIHRGLEHVGGRSQKTALSEDVPLCCAVVDEKLSVHASSERHPQTSGAAVAVRKLLSSVARRNYAVVEISRMEVMSAAAGSVVTGKLLRPRTCGDDTVQFNGCERAERSKPLEKITQVRLIIPVSLQMQLNLTALQHWPNPPQNTKLKHVTCYCPSASPQQPVFLVLSKPRLLRFQRRIRRYNERGNGEEDTICKEVPLLLHSGIAAVTAKSKNCLEYYQPALCTV